MSKIFSQFKPPRNFWQIDQSGFLLKTYSQNRYVLKLFSEGVNFWRDVAGGVGELDTWPGEARQWR